VYFFFAAMKVLFFSLLLIAAFAYQVHIVNDRCYVQATHKNRKGQEKQVWLDMSRFLGTINSFSIFLLNV